MKRLYTGIVSVLIMGSATAVHGYIAPHLKPLDPEVHFAPHVPVAAQQRLMAVARPLIAPQQPMAPTESERPVGLARLFNYVKSKSVIIGVSSCVGAAYCLWRYLKK